MFCGLGKLCSVRYLLQDCQDMKCETFFKIMINSSTQRILTEHLLCSGSESVVLSQDQTHPGTTSMLCTYHPPPTPSRPATVSQAMLWAPVSRRRSEGQRCKRHSLGGNTGQKAVQVQEKRRGRNSTSEKLQTRASVSRHSTRRQPHPAVPMTRHRLPVCDTCHHP